MTSRAVHVLKSVLRSFEATWLGENRHQVRAFDRPYVVGDLVVLLEFSPVAPPSRGQAGPSGWWGNRAVVARISHLTPPGVFGLPQHLCVFSLGGLIPIFESRPDQRAWDHTRPPQPGPAPLPADVLAAWAAYHPRPLEPAFLISLPPADPAAAPGTFLNPIPLREHLKKQAAKVSAARKSRNKPAARKGARRR